MGALIMIREIDQANRLYLPAEIRERARLETGDRVEIRVENQVVQLRPAGRSKRFSHFNIDPLIQFYREEGEQLMTEQEQEEWSQAVGTLQKILDR